MSLLDQLLSEVDSAPHLRAPLYAATAHIALPLTLYERMSAWYSRSGCTQRTSACSGQLLMCLANRLIVAARSQCKYGTDIMGCCNAAGPAKKCDSAHTRQRDPTFQRMSPRYSHTAAVHALAPATLRTAGSSAGLAAPYCTCPNSAGCTFGHEPVRAGHKRGR